MPAKRTQTTEEYVTKAVAVHNGTYHYDKTKYVNSKTKVCITCTKHGDFLQAPYDHLNGSGCPLCKADNRSYSWEEILCRFPVASKEYYKYDETTYSRVSAKMRMFCPVHGEFWQKPELHINGSGCKKCTASGGPGKYCESVFAQNPHLKLREAWIYLIEMVDTDLTTFFKIGITTDFKSRILCHLPNTTTVKWFRRGTLYECFKEEQKILKNYAHFKYTPKTEVSGKHECLSKECWNEFLSHN